MLREKLERLYKLSIQKENVVREMGSWDESIWSWDLKWRRMLLPRENNMLIDLLHILDMTKLRQAEKD